MNIKNITLLAIVIFCKTVLSQNWQQKVKYTMEIDMDVNTYQYSGKQKLKYYNNSPDDLTKVFYHLQFNAFQPGSAMDTRLKNIKDPDGRMVKNVGTEEQPKIQSRIEVLKPEEQGYIKVKSLTQNGSPVVYHIEGTILEVELNKPIKSGKSAVLYMEFDGQVPLQIRRSGRNSEEGVALSMTQWYPKLAEYDYEGWHADPYIGREFYGVWGDFEVKIAIDKDYVIGGTGYLQNAKEIGYGYENSGETVVQKVAKNGKLTWHFKAKNIHDFSWAADKDFIHTRKTAYNGTELHFLYKKDLKQKHLDNWTKLPEKVDELLQFYNENIGVYPYKQYSVIQGGDGGMEYAMCTLVTGKRNYGSLVGVVAHEMAHSWFQFVLATNESKYPWMDEGFTTYISTIGEAKVLGNKVSFANTFGSYKNLVGYKIQQPLTTHADAYDYNFTYGVSSYNKGALFLHQLGYIIGKENLAKTLKAYFKEYKFKHPTDTDFIRVAEKVSGLELDWYLNYWIRTIDTIDYSVALGGKQVVITRKGTMPMPIELTITYKDGTQELFYIPLAIMRGEKKSEVHLLKDWSWTNPVYTFELSKEAIKVEIDPSRRLMDIHMEDNVFEVK